ncbi:uncharacterized protein LOC110461474 [Mizuhopecten yessoensis]|uniref:uncharacterized protein LOC110461474 n=1 Tax=Mizuhopecten yessoensis TaxID=6573 RepID=UPI000B45C739|nr:uncharacterized protein LOC110461474 [Mizuhopecten yessoensis]
MMGNSKGKASESNAGQAASAELPVSNTAAKKVDPRLPFGTYRQQFNTVNAWKPLMRTLEKSAKENLIRFIKKYPHYKDCFPNAKNIEKEETMRASLEFGIDAMGTFQVFDDVISNLEEVDVAIKKIKRTAKIGLMSLDMIKDMKVTFLELVGDTLGDRWTDATKENFTLLYDFILEEYAKAL